jgi:rSAM/selenodomain-associated transferase 2
MPSLSVIVPALNEAGHIRQTLSDLAPARRQGHEVIMVDGGSTDATISEAGDLADQVIEAARGRASQMNAGARAAHGDLLWFLHADTRVPPQAFDALLVAADTGARWGRFDVRLSGRQWLLRIVERSMNWRSCITGIATGDQGIFVTRKAFEQVGRYPDIPLMEDIALSKALKRIARPACVGVRLVTSSRRWEEKGVLRTVALMWRLRLAYATGTSPAQLVRRYYP